MISNELTKFMEKLTINVTFKTFKIIHNNLSGFFPVSLWQWIFGIALVKIQIQKAHHLPKNFFFKWKMSKE